MKNLLFLFLLISTSTFAQLTDLCGLWWGENYTCNGESFPEVILIEHDGSFTTATKIIGDYCVTDGQITWQGDFIENPFYVTFTAGNPFFPGSVYIEDIELNVINSTYIETSVGVSFSKMIFNEIDSLNLDLNVEEICKLDDLNLVEINLPKRKLIKIIDILGKEYITPPNGKILFYLYDNGEVEKIIKF